MIFKIGKKKIVICSKNTITMENNYWNELAFENKNFAEKPLSKGEYENCSFVNCNFASCNLYQYIFDRCTFDNCNLSGTNLSQTSLREVSFSNCKMLGIHFDACNPFLFSIFCEGCALNLSSFYKMKLKGIRFKNCSLQEVDFTEANLSNSIFEHCNLHLAIFENTNLSHADLRSAEHFSIHTSYNKLHKTKFSAQGLIGLCKHLDILIS